MGMVNLGTPSEPSTNTEEDSGPSVNSVSWSEAKTGYFESLRDSQGGVGMMTVVNKQRLQGLTLTLQGLHRAICICAELQSIS